MFHIKFSFIIIMSNTIVECRNKESDITVSNGDWTTILGGALTINDGDQIFVKNAFIDTQATSSQKIRIPEDINAEIEFGYYKNMNDVTGLIAGISGGAPVASEDEKLLTILIESTDPTLLLYKEFNFTPNDQNKVSDPVAVKVLYDDFFDVADSRTINLGEMQPGETTDFFEMIGKIVKGPITFEPSLDTLREKFNIKVNTTTQATNGKTVMQPYTQKATIPIKAGNYDPDHLCKIINDSITATTVANNPFYPNDTDCLLNSKETQSNYRFAGANTNEFLFVNGFANPNYYIDNMKNFGTGTEIWLGSNQFELAFDANTRNFQFNYLHFPYYYQKNIAVGFFEYGGNYHSVARNGGNVIFSLQAKEQATGNPFDFWFDLLGFDTTIYPDFSFAESNLGTGTTYLVPIILFNDNSTTDGLVSVDTLINIDNPVAVPTTFPYYSTVGTNTRAIDAGNSVLDNENSFGYYVVEVSSNFKNNFYTPDNNYRNIQSIVSRYYELNSYTSGTANGSLIYTHKGDSQLLESFRCRILDSDKNLATNIGDDNTIHLAIVRNKELNQDISNATPKEK